MNRKVDIETASEAELREFGRDTLGLTLPPNAKIETLRAKVKAAHGQDQILIADDEPQSPMEGSAPIPVKPSQMPPDTEKVRIIIQETEEAGGSDPVPIGVNGKVMLVPRGKEVDIPETYFEVLRNAISHKYDPLPDGGINPIPRKVPLYPYQRVA